MVLVENISCKYKINVHSFKFFIMKKLSLLFILFSFTLISKSQKRVIDLEMLRISNPDTVFDNKPVPYTFVVKNNGPDDIQTGDTLAYRINYVLGIQTINFPSIFRTFEYIVKKTIKKGDSLTINEVLSQRVDVLVNRIGDVCAGAYIINGGLIKDESDIPTTGHNNGDCKGCYFYDPNLPGLSVPERIKVNKKEIEIYPNPASNTVNFKVRNAKGLKNYHLKITDVTGKLLVDKDIELNNNEFTLENISFWADGIYIVQISSASELFTGKFIKS